MKYIVFEKTTHDNELNIHWIKGVKYKISDETNDLYFLNTRKGIKFAVDKKTENKDYKVFKGVVFD